MNYSSIFSSKVQNLTVFSIIYMIRIRFFGPRESNQKRLGSAQYFPKPCLGNKENNSTKSTGRYERREVKKRREEKQHVQYGRSTQLYSGTRGKYFMYRALAGRMTYDVWVWMCWCLCGLCVFVCVCVGACGCLWVSVLVSVSVSVDHESVCV